jgi:hypothetical protein
MPYDVTAHCKVMKDCGERKLVCAQQYVDGRWSADSVRLVLFQASLSGFSRVHNFFGLLYDTP